MVEVFRTNVACGEHAGTLSAVLAARFGLSGISFDLEDCDRVLRVEGPAIEPGNITAVLGEHGFECTVME